jgi:integrase
MTTARPARPTTPPRTTGPLDTVTITTLPTYPHGLDPHLQQAFTSSGLTWPAFTAQVLDIFSRPALPTVADVVPRALADMQRYQPGSYTAWGLYVRLLVDGLPDECPCSCSSCAVGPCPCPESIDVHHAMCQPSAQDPRPCSQRYRGVADRTVADLETHDIIDLAWWAERRALKKTVRQNLNRAASGRTTKTTDGRGAAESAISGTRWVLRWSMNKKDTGVKANVAMGVKTPSRQEIEPRSLSPEQFLEIFGVAVTTGRDPELDGLILRHQLIQGVRRGGVLVLKCGGLDAGKVTVKYWDQKKKTHRTRPSTAHHMASLLAHVSERGPRIAAPADAPAHLRREGLLALQDSDPVFYNRPTDTRDAEGNLLHREVHPITRKKFETLYNRIKRHLPWADDQWLRPHDMRHTSAAVIDEVAGQQMAQLHLAHDSSSSTSYYTRKHHAELAKLKEDIFGAPVQDATDGWDA